MSTNSISIGPILPSLGVMTPPNPLEKREGNVKGNVRYKSLRIDLRFIPSQPNIQVSFSYIYPLCLKNKHKNQHLRCLLQSEISLKATYLFRSIPEAQGTHHLPPGH